MDIITPFNANVKASLLTSYHEHNVCAKWLTILCLSDPDWYPKDGWVSPDFHQTADVWWLGWYVMVSVGEPSLWAFSRVTPHSLQVSTYVSTHSEQKSMVVQSITIYYIRQTILHTINRRLSKLCANLKGLAFDNIIIYYIIVPSLYSQSCVKQTKNGVHIGLHSKTNFHL